MYHHDRITVDRGDIGDEGILTKGQAESRSIISLRLPFCIEPDNKHGDVGGRSGGGSLGEPVDGILFLVADAAAAIVIATAND